jgi:hypothetical protein
MGAADPVLAHDPLNTMQATGLVLLNLWFTIPLMDGQFDHVARSQRLLLHLPVLVFASFLAWRRPSGAVA